MTQQTLNKLAPLIAIIGCDGSGKSTVSEEVLTFARRFGAAEAAHLGKQAGNIGRAIANLPLIGGLLGRIIVAKTDKTRAQRDKTSPGIFTALIIYAFSLKRMHRFKRMLALRRHGSIVVTDRFPQLELPGAYDSVELSTTADNGLIVGWLARCELRLYEWMTSYKPDLVIRLNVDLDTACARKPDHRRELLASKIAATPLLKFNGAPIVEIDSTQPLAVVIAEAKAAVAHTLTKRGYAQTNL
ncbi:MAG: thymidylate kinase [Methylotenera sp.]|nr:thymidylate kinase [Methylotenera sp.]